MSVNPAFQWLVGSGLTSVMKPRGFSRRGQTFYRRTGDNVALVNVQKSVKSTARNVRFTVNLGIVSGELLRFFSPNHTSKYPSVDTCHWRQRLGHLLPGNRDRWWTIHETTNISDLAEQFRMPLEELAIPELDVYVRDERLRHLWLNRRS